MDVKKINGFLSDLAVWNVKLHDIHWNARGLHFVMVHEYTEGLYDKVFEKYDEVAELLKMQNEMPLSTMKEYLENASIEEVNKGEYITEDAFEIIYNDMKMMREKALEIRNEASEKDEFQVANLFEGYVEEWDKDLWFFNSILKK